MWTLNSFESRTGGFGSRVRDVGATVELYRVWRDRLAGFK
jgi:hypothetical protein